MKKKIQITLLGVCLMFVVTGCIHLTSSTTLMNYGDYKKITKDNIKQIEIVRYTEAGDNRKIVDKESIPEVYDNLNKKKIGNKTDMSCLDNTTVYIFTLDTGEKISIEIECEWVVINNIRYILE